MNRFLDLEDLDDAAIAHLLALANDVEARPARQDLAGRVLGLVFMNPSVRTLASFQAGMAQLGGSSFVITPGQGSWGFETRTGVVMDGIAAEHVREGMPVLAGYADAIGVRCFAGGERLDHDLSEPVLSAIAAVTPGPLINLESAVNHPCQALADWKTLDDLDVPRTGRFVLSWAYHKKALPLAVPAAALTMAARRGMAVTVLRPDGFGLPPQIMETAAQAAGFSGGSVNETSDRAAALEGAHVLYAKSWQSPAAYGDADAESALREQHRDWCVGEDWFAPSASDAHFMHCLPVRRNVVVDDAVLDGPRSAVQRQANNRLHVQKAVLLEVLGKGTVT
ncbi:MAG: acetylornithine carbamoyltransferase [Planctomycetes bacterium]|nr:acetylornithine carbamoyltransferase [Planctomycetota bacterium]